MISEWAKRRMVVTKERVSFAIVDNNAELDRIPFVDIEYIKDSKVDGPGAGSGIDKSCIEIGTKLDGYNSGRTYHIRMKENITSSKLVKTLEKYAKDAARTQSSYLQRLKSKAQYIYESDIVQSGIALIIMAVRPPNKQTFGRNR